MAGYMYLGSQRVCPAVLMGGSEEFIFPANVEGNDYKGIAEVEFKLPDEAETITDSSVLTNAFGYTAGGSKWLSSVDLNKLKSITGTSAFNTAFARCTNLKTFSASELETINSTSCFQSAFYNDSKLKTVNFEKLKTLNGKSVFSQAFGYCSDLDTVNFGKLETIGEEGTNNSQYFYRAFRNCTSLREVRFNSLSKVYPLVSFGQAFMSCTNLDLYFPALTESSFEDTPNYVFDSIFQSGSNCALHLPSNLSTYITQEIITSILSGSTNCSVLFDLQATE